MRNLLTFLEPFWKGFLIQILVFIFGYQSQFFSLLVRLGLPFTFLIASLFTLAKPIPIASASFLLTVPLLFTVSSFVFLGISLILCIFIFLAFLSHDADAIILSGLLHLSEVSLARLSEFWFRSILCKPLLALIKGWPVFFFHYLLTGWTCWLFRLGLRFRFFLLLFEIPLFPIFPSLIPILSFCPCLFISSLCLSCILSFPIGGGGGSGCRVILLLGHKSLN